MVSSMCNEDENKEKFKVVTYRLDNGFETSIESSIFKID